MEYLRTVDLAAFEQAVARHKQDLVDEDLGSCWSNVMYIKTEPGGGTPGGFHAHDWDQLFYILSGTLTIEVEGQEPFEAGPDTMVCYPKGLQHRNWNKTSEPAAHLSINFRPLAS
jgi:quercetin dioxygenase-like cupin family protein